jgi:hypothetical protein
MVQQDNGTSVPDNLNVEGQNILMDYNIYKKFSNTFLWIMESLQCA